MAKLAVILVNYNGLRYNKECIDSILSSKYGELEIIVVDNDSTDGSIEALEELFGNSINIIKLGENLGFSVANNKGIELALSKNCEYIVLLNNDTVVDSNMFNIMVEASIRNKSAVIAPKIYYYDNKDIIWSAGGSMNWKKGVSDQRGLGEKEQNQYNSEVEVEFATGCCLLIPQQIIKDIGYLSDEYFLYYEDTDYCMRIKAKDYRIIYEPKAFMYHKVSASTGGEESPNYIYYNTRNRLMFNDKYNGKNKLYYIPYFYLTRVIKGIIWFASGKGELVKASVAGIKDYYKGNYKKWSK